MAKAGGGEGPVERIKDPLVGILWRVELKAQLCGIKGEPPSTAQGQRISTLQGLLCLDIPSSKPLSVNCSPCLTRCCPQETGLQSGVSNERPLRGVS